MGMNHNIYDLMEWFWYILNSIAAYPMDDIEETASNFQWDMDRFPKEFK